MGLFRINRNKTRSSFPLYIRKNDWGERKKNKMKTFTRHDKEGNSGIRVIEVDKCWDCPHGTATRRTIGWFVDCKKTGEEYCFDDNGTHFSTPADCPLEYNPIKEAER